MPKKIFLWVFIFGLVFLFFELKPGKALGAPAPKNIYDAQALYNGDIAIIYIDEGKICYGIFAPNTSTWQSQQIDIGSQGAMAIDTLGSPHLVYVNAAQNLTYIYETALGWSAPQIIESLNFNDVQGVLSHPNILVDDNGFAHISYHDSAGGYFFFNDYAPYDKEDLIYATNLSGSFVRNIISYSDGWQFGENAGQSYAFPSSKIVAFENNYYFCNMYYVLDKYLDINEYTYKYNIFNTYGGIAYEYIIRITAFSDSTISLLAAKADNTGIYALYQSSGRIHLNKGGLPLPAAENNFSPSIGDLALGTEGQVYYAASNGEDLLLYQNGIFKEGISLPQSMAPNANIVTLVGEDTQYVLYFSQSGQLFLGKNSLTPGDITFDWFTLGGKEDLTIDGIEVESKTYDRIPISYRGSPVSRDDDENPVEIEEYTYTYISTDEGGYSSAVPPYKVGEYKLVIEIPESNLQYKGKKEISFQINLAQIYATGITGQEKNYDGNCQIALSGGVLEGVLDADDVNLVLPPLGLTVNAGAEDNKIVLPQGELALAGDDASNYSLAYINEIRANIKKAPLEINQVNLGVKAYDGNTQGIIESIIFNGLQNGESLNYGVDYSATAQFADPNAGININISGVASLIASNKANNYILAEGTFNLQGDILKGEGLTVQGAGLIALLKNSPREYTFNLSSLVLNKDDTGSVIYKMGGLTGEEIFSRCPELNPDGIIMGFTTKNLSTGAARQIIIIETENYEDILFAMDFSFAEKTLVNISNISIEDKIYDGIAIAVTGIPIAEENGNPIEILEYNWLYQSTDAADYNSQEPPINAGAYKLIVSVPTDNDDYEGSLEIAFNINKKELIIRPKSYSIYERATLPLLEYEAIGLAEGEDVNEAVQITAGGLEPEAQDAMGTPLINANQKGAYVIAFKNQPEFISPNYTVNIGQGSLLIKASPSSPQIIIESPGGEIPKGSGGEDTLTLEPKIIIENKAARLIILEGESKKILGANENIKKIVIAPILPQTVDTVSLGLNRQVFSALTQGRKDILLETGFGLLAIDIHSFGPALGEKWQNLTLSLKHGQGSSLQIEVIIDGRVVDIIDGLWVVLPMENKTTTAVLMIIKEDGTNEVIGKSFITPKGLAGAIKGSATIKLAENKKAFADVNPSHWAGEYIDFTSSRLLFEGLENKGFMPDAPMSRGMLVTVLHRLEGLERPMLGAGFFDVGNNFWYAQGVDWAFTKGLISGYPGGGFAPDKGISREELAVIIFNYASALGLDTSCQGDISVFQDREKTSPWAKAALEYLIGEGLIEGRGNNFLAPKALVTRAEVSAIIYRLMPLLNTALN